MARRASRNTLARSSQFEIPPEWSDAANDPPEVSDPDVAAALAALDAIEDGEREPDPPLSAADQADVEAALAELDQHLDEEAAVECDALEKLLREGEVITRVLG